MENFFRIMLANAKTAYYVCSAFQKTTSSSEKLRLVESVLLTLSIFSPVIITASPRIELTVNRSPSNSPTDSALQTSWEQLHFQCFYGPFESLLNNSKPLRNEKDFYPIRMHIINCSEIVLANFRNFWNLRWRYQHDQRMLDVHNGQPQQFRANRWNRQYDFTA